MSGECLLLPILAPGQAFISNSKLLEPTNTYNEKWLLQQVAEGNEDAFRQLFHHWKNRVYHFVFSITQSGDTSEDAVQDIFLKLWMMKERVTGIDNLESYLRVMARNQAYSGFRRRALETLVKDRLRGQEAGEDYADSELLAGEVRQFISRIVDQLTPMQRKVFLLSREKGLRHEEIAQVLGISRNTVKQHMKDALRCLRQELVIRYGPGSSVIAIVFCLSAG